MRKYRIDIPYKILDQQIRYVNILTQQKWDIESIILNKGQPKKKRDERKIAKKNRKMTTAVLS